MASGVFSLKKVYKKQCEDVLNGDFSSWPESATYGYFGGGYTGGTNSSSVIDRLDFLTEVLSAPGKNLTIPRNSFATLSSSSYGYYGAGLISPITPGITSAIDRLDFSTETISSPGKNLSQARYGLAALSSSFYGYFGGGNTPTPTIVCTVDRLDFSTETTSTPGKGITQARFSLASVSSNSYGYFGGGRTAPSTQVCTIDRLDFSTETTTAPGKGITQARFLLNGVSNTSYGYFGGGYFPGVPANYLCTIDRLDFSTETTSAPGKGLIRTRSDGASSSSSFYGYFGLGRDVNGSISTIDRLDFSTETATGLGANLPQAKTQLAGSNLSGGQSIRRPTTTIGNKTYGYFGGGGVLTPDLTTLIDRLDFSTETVTVPSPKLPQRRINMGVSSSGTYGYFGGGYVFSPVPDYVSEITRLDFSSDTISVPTPKLTTKKSRLNASSSSTYGYFGGGYVGPVPSPVLLYSTIERLDFLNETISTPTTRLSRQKRNLAGTSSEQYGYYGGGNIIPMPPVANKISDIDRLDFSTETTTRTAFLPTAKDVMGATSSNNYAYYAGGSLPTYVNVINRLDFSTESVTISPAVLTASRGNIAATSSSSYGYFGGGYFTPVASVSSVIDRLDFSSETVQTSTPLKLTLSRWGASAVSNSN